MMFINNVNHTCRAFKTSCEAKRKKEGEKKKLAENFNELKVWGTILDFLQNNLQLTEVLNLTESLTSLWLKVKKSYN